MYCKKCGVELDNKASFCPKCGTKVETFEEEYAEPEKERPQDMPDVGYYATTVKDYAVKAKDRALGMTVNKALAIISVFCMLLIMVTPYTVATFWNSQTYTLFGSLSAFIMSVYGGGWKALFIIAYIAFICMFALGTFFGKTRAISTLGCCGLWLLFIITIIEIITTNSFFGYGMLSFGFGFYVWIVGGVLSIISIFINNRKAPYNT